MSGPREYVVNGAADYFRRMPGVHTPRPAAFVIVREPSGPVIPRAKAPTVIHETLPKAIAEAERLARREHCEFGVFQLVGAARPLEVPVQWEWAS